MWSLYCVNAFQSAITGSLATFIVSGFENAPLVGVIEVVASTMSAASYMPMAKILNVWDRSVGFAIMAAFAVLGLILSATCTNLATYCAAQVFYTVGFAGLIFSVDVITADTSTLRNRGLAYAFTSSPYMISAFAGPAIAEYFNDSNWRWAYGCFAIILPVVAAPMWWLLRHHRAIAIKNGTLTPRPKSNRSWIQSTWAYTVELDLLGVFLLGGGLTLFLLPFSLAGYAADGWGAGYIIAMLVLGFILLVAFYLVERYAPRPFLPWHTLTSRTILGACLIELAYQIAYYCWDDYYTSYLMVVFNASITKAGDISNIFSIVSGVFLFFIGMLITKTGRYRWLFLWAVPLYIVGEGLMIEFRQPHWGIGWNIFCQVVIALAGGVMIINQQVAVTAASSHNDCAAALALLGTFGWIGGAVGGSISGAIWTNVMPGLYQKYLPASALADWEDIYNDIDVQLSYPVGSAVRDAINKVYCAGQKYMLSAGTGFMAIALVAMFLVKDKKLAGMAQTKGTLF